MRGPRSVAALFVAAILLGICAQPAAAFVTIDSSGRTGAWAVNDSATDASLRCTYDAGNLVSMTVAPPQVKAIARQRRKVGWEMQVWRAKWWQSIPDTNQWYLAYSGGVVKANATNTTAALFGPQQWAIPAKFQTAYDSLKVRLVLHWYALDKVTEIGHTTIELEYFGQEYAGQPFDPQTSTFAGNCPGSQNAPQPPARGVVANVPGGFVAMSHWRPYWKSFTTEDVQAMIAELNRMHQTGVVLMGMATGNKYALPTGVATYLQMLRDAGIKPYLALWIGPFSSAETDTAVKAWNAGNGLWSGIVLDAEAGLMSAVEQDRAGAIAAVGRFMTRVRPLTPFLAYSTMAIASDYPDMLYSELNGYCDAFMPQAYFKTTETALKLLDAMQASVDYESAGWSGPPKPIIPVVNDWGNGVDIDQLRSYIEIAFARYGAVSAWRLHPDMHQDVKDLWSTFPE